MSIRQRRRGTLSWVLTLLATVLALTGPGFATGQAVFVETPIAGSYSYDAAQQPSADTHGRSVVVARTAEAALQAAPGHGVHLTPAVPTGVAAETAPSLKSLAAEVREAGLHPAAQNNRTIAVGVDSEGGLFAGSSNLFDAGQRAALERLGITRVPGSGALHAEEELLRGVPDLQRVGTSVRALCGPAEHDCALQLLERGVGVE